MTINNITVIIPIHETSELIEGLTNKAIASLPSEGVKVMVVAPKNVIDTIKLDVTPFMLYFVENTGDTDFASQVNLGAKECDTEFFSILEFDDTYEQYFFNDLPKFLSDGDFSNSDIILPLVGFHTGDDQVSKLVNDAAWTQGFSNDRGFLDLDSTSMYDVFVITGGVIRTSTFLEIGGIKSDIKIYFSKEFLMRAIFNDKVVSVYPKLGYKHYVGREGSFFDTLYKSNITKHENEFYNRKTIEEYKLNPNAEDYEKITYTAPATDV